MISNRDYIRDIKCQNDECGADVYFYGAEFKPGEMVERWNRRTEK